MISCCSENQSEARVDDSNLKFASCPHLSFSLHPPPPPRRSVDKTVIKIINNVITIIAVIKPSVCHHLITQAMHSKVILVSKFLPIVVSSNIVTGNFQH